jgi:polar amino acid transport system substrate-binding protein
MKRIIIFWVFFLFAGAGTIFAQEIIFDTQDFPPFSYMNGKDVTGPAVDIITAVCKKAGIACSFRLLPWARAQEEVKKGQAQALFLIGWNKERAETLNFSPPVLDTAYGIFVNTDNALVYTLPKNLDGYTIGVYGPSNTSTSLDELNKKVPGGLVIDLSPNEETAFRKLSMKRIGSVYSNRDVGGALISKLALANVRYAGTDKPLKYFIGFSKQYADKSVFDRFVKEYKNLYAKGTIKKILDSYRLSIATIE